TKTYTAYVGSYLGGPVYIRDERVSFSVTVSGGVRYSHYILGYTTPEDFEENAKSSAPYFDLEVWDNGVLHSGPVKYAKAFSYDDLYKVAVYWDKVSLVSTKVSTQGIVFLYDPFVAAGDAVAFPGQRSVNCPSGWMASSLNYNALVRGGSWGNMHEYNHNYQGYGVGNGGEVTNNAMTLVEYSLFTQISSARKTGNYGAEGLSGWNRYTSATWAIDQLTSARFDNGRQGLALYAALLHNFGQEAFINALQTQRSGSYGQSYTGYLRAWSEVTHNDMSFYFNELLGAELSDEVIGQYTEDSYPTFIPFASIYQTGRSYTCDGEKRTFETMQPFQIEYGEDFTVDLNKYTVNGNEHSGSVVLPEGFDFKIKNITQPEHGSLKKTGEKLYTFTPDSNLRSGKIVVTVSLEATNNAYKNYKLEDFDIILEFEQSHEMNKSMLERTTYTFAAGSVPASAAEAFESGYKGYVSKTEGDNVNRTQNCNTDIWYTNQEGDELPANSVVELSGKLHAEEAGKYRIALRGRWNIALYVSLDGGKTYESVGAAQDWTGNAFMSGGAFNEKCPYKDYELEADTWVYFKAVMITEQKGTPASFIGVGWGKFTPPQGIINEDGELIGETPESVSVAYASAYRNSYELVASDFTSDYFYMRDYTYTYSRTDTYGEKQVYVTGNYEPWTSNVEEGHFDIGNLFDGKSDTNIHTSQSLWVSTQKPLILIVDMQETVTVNSMTLLGYTESNAANIGFPGEFTLYGSTTGTELDDFTLIKEFKGVSRSGRNATVTFDTATFRYYRLMFTGSDNGRIALNGITFANNFSLGKGHLIAPDDDAITYRG
ncbi:MAG: M60 family metallopeptidase, partial [Clostridia bacterium]|nr:M60 family metallopeptidase [Clostridia bacterium]